MKFDPDLVDLGRFEALIPLSDLDLLVVRRAGRAFLLFDLVHNQLPNPVVGLEGLDRRSASLA